MGLSYGTKAAKNEDENQDVLECFDDSNGYSETLTKRHSAVPRTSDPSPQILSRANTFGGINMIPFSSPPAASAPSPILESVNEAETVAAGESELAQGAWKSEVAEAETATVEHSGRPAEQIEQVLPQQELEQAVPQQEINTSSATYKVVEEEENDEYEDDFD